METAEEKVARVELENAQLRDRVARVAERPGELERRPGLNGGNSGKPSSSDGLKKPAAERRTRSLRGKTGRQPGGQAGHEGRTLCRTGRPDRVKEHVPAVCRGCGASLRSASAVGRPVARRVFDLPEPRPPEVTAHRGHACRCGRCGVVTRASFPKGVSGPVRYGPRLSGVAVWLRHGRFLPERRLSEAPGVLFGARVSPATLASMSRRAAERLRVAAGHMEELAARKARAKHPDETGLRPGGRTRWLHAMRAPLLAAYRMLLADGGGGARALQCASPAGVAGACGVRRGGPGAAPAASDQARSKLTHHPHMLG